LNTPKALIASYREGLGLAAVTLVVNENGACLVNAAADAPLDSGRAMQARWWCKSVQQAEWLVESAARLARTTQADGADAVSRLRGAINNAAKRLGIVLRSDDEIAGEAAAVIARLEAEIAAQQRAGSLKSVNRGYRDYRLQASARGEKVLRYADWMARYKAKLVREIAQNLRAL
jgi:hypothetical protein